MNILNWIDEKVWDVIFLWHSFLHINFGGYVFSEGDFADNDSDFILIHGDDRDSVLEAINSDDDFTIDYSGDFAVVKIRKEEVVFSKKGVAYLGLSVLAGKVHIGVWSNSVEGIEKLVNRFLRINTTAEVPSIEIPGGFND